MAFSIIAILFVVAFVYIVAMMDKGGNGWMSLMHMIIFIGMLWILLVSLGRGGVSVNQYQLRYFLGSNIMGIAFITFAIGALITRGSTQALAGAGAAISFLAIAL